ncbi:hypothetical protein MgSA37_03920 [Mucilaginibacter gotjawali]|uniref:Uncharacterized protein n=2 Tax=Mucilaginibacter gotjawali TaxID=1550579 RepID=A0A839SMP2_9SPHI|nr:hypothetical protein [Mucilaginibacter gotjawali]BAU55728.1 hypothetical protein MgSA37_03920 [Mucilaginibacter gotjawali]
MPGSRFASQGNHTAPSFLIALHNEFPLDGDRSVSKRQGAFL